MASNKTTTHRLITCIGILIIFWANIDLISSKDITLSANKLAEKTRAVHFEEHYEPLITSEESRGHNKRKRSSNEDLDYENYKGIIGTPGIDFPAYQKIPKTTFSCRKYGNGYFADLDTDCQVFHICDDGRKISFLCPNGTIFQQNELICDWWFKVNCRSSPAFYAESREILAQAQKRRQSHNRNKEANIEYRTKISYELDGKKFELNDEETNENKTTPFKSSSTVTTTENIKTIVKNNLDEDESQVAAESSSFFDNGRNLENYNNDKPKVNNEKINTTSDKPKTSRNRKKSQNGNSRNLRKNFRMKAINTTSTTTRTPNTYHQKQKPINRLNTYSTARKIELSRTTPYYTPTIPIMHTKKSENENISTKTTTSFPATIFSTKQSTTTSQNRLNKTSTALNPILDKSLNDASGLRSYNFSFGTRNGSSFYGSEILGDTAYYKRPLTTQKLSSPKSTTFGTTPRTSSAGPTYLPKGTTGLDVLKHVQGMIKTLNELEDNQKEKSIGLNVPPSSGPDSLHSLALFYATTEGTTNINTKTTPEHSTLPSNILRGDTINHFENLFGSTKNTKEEETTTIASNDISTNLYDSNELDFQQSNDLLRNLAGKPETRRIAQLFTNALSAYLENPISFRKVLQKVQPTNGTYISDSRELLNYAGSTYLATQSEEILSTTDFSNIETTTELFSYELSTPRPSTYFAERLPGSRMVAEKEHNIKPKLNPLAAEVNNEFTSIPLQNNFDDYNDGKIDLNKSSKYNQSKTEINHIFHTRQANQTELDSIKHSPISFDLLPPIWSAKKLTEIEPNNKILPPNFDDDDDILQRAQSQSFIPSHNHISYKDIGEYKNNAKFNTKHTTELPKINETSSERLSAYTYSNYLNAMTINDELTVNTDETTTTTTTTTPTTDSPHTYLPKTNIKSSKNLNLKNLDADTGMKEIASKMFGTLNESSTNHLMNIMKKADRNQTVRKLILLLIQTCDTDHNRTVEQSRQALLNALIDMDEQNSDDDDIRIIKIGSYRRNKSLRSNYNTNNNNVIKSTTDLPPITTYRPNSDDNYHTSIWTTANSYTTTQSNLDQETTKFQIHVADFDYETKPTTIVKSSTDIEPITTSTDIINTASSTQAVLSNRLFENTNYRSGRRKSKSVGGSLSQPEEASHRNSDQRALELLKSLYSVASKFGRR